MNISFARAIVPRRFTVAVAIALPLAWTPISQAAELSLTDAVTRASQVHPLLKAFPLQQNALNAEAQTANFGPALQLNAELENFAGSGEAQGLSASEATLSLSSVFEMGGKRAARLSTIRARRDQLAVSQRAATLDIATEVARRFLNIVVIREHLNVARDEQALAADTVAAVQKRVNVGAAPRPELRRANAALFSAEIKINQLHQQLVSAKALLALMWNGDGNTIGEVNAKLFSNLSAGDLNAMLEQLKSTADIELFSVRDRVAAAEVQQAQSAASTDIGWQIGVRRLQGSQDTALVAGISLPLNGRSRNAASIAAAQAQRDLIGIDREVALLTVRTQLQSEYQRRVTALASLATLQQKVIPELRQALEETSDAYERGRYSYLERVAARAELIAAREAAVNAAAEAQLARLELERLTGTALVATNSGNNDHE